MAFRPSPPLFASLVGLATLAATPAVRAQSPSGFALDRFEPAERGSEWFANESFDLRGHGRPAVGVLTSWAYRPLVVYAPNRESVRGSIVRNQIVVHPGMSLVLWDRLRVAANLPLQVFADGRTTSFNGTDYRAPANVTSIGDVRLGADVRLLGVHGEPFTLGVGLQAWLPTGDVESYSGDGSLRVAPRILASGDVSFFTYAARLGFVVRERNDRYADSPVGSELTFAAAAGVRLFRSLVIGPEVFGGSVVTGDTTLANGNTQTTALDTLLGAHYTLGALRFGAGVGAGLTRGFGSPVARSVLHVEWSPDVPLPEFHDKDADGIADEDDACPTVGGYHTGDPRTNGCPEPVHDRDKDGIVDELDVCPDLAGIRSVDPKSNGCPPDRDGDTVADAEDACPDVQGVRAADPKKSGCPADSDADGVVDSADACPNEAGLTTTDPKTNGCPDPDRDKDGIPNADDACPDEAGKVDPDPKRSGCPKAFVREGQIRILDQVKFKTGSAAIQPGKDSQEVLDAVLRILKDHSEITKLRVEGHTDDKGAAATNKKLSANRAAAVVQWLVAHGIEASRLSSTGLGSDKPLVPNDTADGRTQNRRVEFHIEGPASGS